VILADTSIWADHFRAEELEVRQQFHKRNIGTHPMIVAELALGPLLARGETLALLDWPPSLRVTRLDEVRKMIEARSLHGRGIGLIDAHLIASALIHSTTLLWTREKRLRGMAEALGVCAMLP
jgi:predicted nucleic acid-binding protein